MPWDEQDQVSLDQSVGETPPSESGYRKAEDSDRSCGTCDYFVNGACQMWNASVQAEYVCDEWEPEEVERRNSVEDADFSFMGSEDEAPVAIFLSDARQTLGEDENGLIWKEALSTGQLVMSPGPSQKPVPRPLVVKLRTDNPSKELGLENLVESFQQKAMDHVTIPLSHANRTEENTGFVEKVKIVPSKKKDGGHSLLMGLRITEPDIKDKTKRGTIANASVGVLFNYIRKRDGRKFGQALDHLALTNKPWVDGLTPFGVNASEVVFLSEASGVDLDDETLVWNHEDSYDWIREQVQETIQEVKDCPFCKSEMENREGELSGGPYVEGLTADKFLGNHYHRGASHRFVGTWRFGEGMRDILVGKPDTWQEVTLGYIAASEDEWIGLGSSAPLGKPGNKENWVDKVGGLPRYVREVARSLMKKRGMTMSRAIATAISRIKRWALTSKDPKVKAKAAKAVAEWEAKKARSHARGLSEEDLLEGMTKFLLDDEQTVFAKPFSRMNLAEARAHRKLSNVPKVRKEVNMSTETPEKEKEETTTATTGQRDEALLAEVADLREKVRMREVDDKIKALQGSGHSPAFCKEVKALLLADDGGPVLQLQLSEEEGGEFTLSLSEVIDRLVEAMPKPEISKELGKQANLSEAGDRPEDDTEKEKKPVEERSQAVAEDIGDSRYLAAAKKAAK